ncbi:MAG: tRNA-intron lyase [Candidatus Aenigmatarchaeota archaeon]|nr:tRNA-intron lyase [Candidatus Aenigmarchaeota archaeon]
MKIKGILLNNRVRIYDFNKAKSIYEEGYYGKLKEDCLDLSLIEACYLLEKEKIIIEDSNKNQLNFEEFYKKCQEIDERFHIKYIVYSDLRNRDLPTRTGFKFGCDFRVYNRGVKPIKRGPKAPHEHTKWIVFVIPYNYKFTFPEFSRAVRLAHNIRAHMLWAVVDENKEVKYFEITFFKP